MSNELKFTGGNWQVKETGGIIEPFKITSDGYTHIAVLKWGTSPSVPETIEEVKANAHLIAASKDLYNALDRFINSTGSRESLEMARSIAIKAMKNANPEYKP